MIVTCPSCTAKYRVRDDAVAPGGAQLRCPECGTLFLAHRPAHDDRELTDAIARVTRAKEEAEASARDLDKRLQDQKADAERQRATLVRANEEAGRALAARDKELLEARAELARLREGAAAAADAQRTSEALDAAQRAVGRLTTELDSAQVVIGNQQAELARLQEQAPSGPGDVDLLALVNAVGPMLWGLDQAVRYLEPFASNEPTLGAHVRHLQLLAGVLKRLVEAGSEPGTQPRLG